MPRLSSGDKKISESSKPSAKVLAAGLLILLAGLFLWIIYALTSQPESFFYRAGPAKSSVLPDQLTEETEPPAVTLMFVGDMMFDRGVKFMVEKNAGGSWRFLFQNIADTLKQADILFGNLEGPISERGRRIGSKYSFRFKPEIAEILKDYGFDVVSVTNNHAGDWGLEAFVDTLSYLEKNNILAAGGGEDDKEAYSPRSLKIKNMLFSFLAFSDLGPRQLEATSSQAGIAWADEEKIKSAVKSAKNKGAFVVVSFHFGEEYQPDPSQRQRLLAELAVEAGADLIVGHHPHVLQPLAAYKDGLIIYSLGNFIFDQYFSEETMSSAIFKVVVQDGRIVDHELIPIELSESYQPQLYYSE